jgi:hypothetical protein
VRKTIALSETGRSPPGATTRKAAMKLRFLADVNFDDRMISGLVRREADLDFQTAVEARLHGLADSEALKIAADSNRVLVTHDKKTMPCRPHLERSFSKDIAPE